MLASLQSPVVALLEESGLESKGRMDIPWEVVTIPTAVRE